MKKYIILALSCFFIQTSHAVVQMPDAFSNDLEEILLTYRSTSRTFKDVVQKALRKDIKDVLANTENIEIIERIFNHLFRDELQIDPQLFEKAIHISLGKRNLKQMCESDENLFFYMIASDSMFLVRYCSLVQAYFSHVFKDANEQTLWNNYTGIPQSQSFHRPGEKEFKIKYDKDACEYDLWYYDVNKRALSEVPMIDSQTVKKIAQLDKETRFIIRTAIYRLALFGSAVFLCEHPDSEVAKLARDKRSFEIKSTIRFIVKGY